MLPVGAYKEVVSQKASLGSITLLWRKSHNINDDDDNDDADDWDLGCWALKTFKLAQTETHCTNTTMSTTITPPTEIPMTMPNGRLLLLLLLGTGVTFACGTGGGRGGAATVF